jgi:hypothetical protein
MLEVAQPELRLAREIARAVSVREAANGVRYGSWGDTATPIEDLDQIVRAVPKGIAAALTRKTYCFVPLTVPDSGEGDGETSLEDFDPGRTMIATRFSTELSDRAICHRNVTVDGADTVFISTRLMQDRFALAFEFYINAGHHFVDAVGVPKSFTSLVWAQVESGVRGETSQDAWEQRGRAVGQQNPQADESAPPARTRTGRGLAARRNQPPAVAAPNVVDEKARSEYFDAAFADAIAIYMLSLTIDFDYSELREREYPLLAASALAERLKHVAQLFPPNAGNEFAIHYRRRNG